MDPITLESSDGREARIHFGYYSMSPREARDFAVDLLQQAQYAERLPSIHERHVDLLASCALCRGEAGAQTDRLTYDEPDIPEYDPGPEVDDEGGMSESRGWWGSGEYPTADQVYDVRGGAASDHEWYGDDR